MWLKRRVRLTHLKTMRRESNLGLYSTAATMNGLARNDNT
jgi:hypothetical protein